MKRIPIKIYTDGSCTTKGDRRGGMGVYLTAEDGYTTYSRGFWNTTTPRMEMHALIAAVQMILPNVPTDVLIFCDSKFIVDAIMNGAVRQWRADGWKGVANADLWKQFTTEVDSRRGMRLYVRHIIGHQKNLTDPDVFGNNVADALADYRKQTSYEQDRALEGYSWYWHVPSSLIFIDKSDKLGELARHDEIELLGDCYFANETDLVDRINGKSIFDDYYSGLLDISFTIPIE